MDQEIIQKLIISTVIFIFIILFFQITKLYAKRTQKKKKLIISRYYALKRIIQIFSGFLLFVSLALIWGINIERAWLSLTGFIAMIAVAFFAVWSLIGNILAGVLLFFTSPFKTEDIIEIMPDGIKGKVLVINLFYTLLEDEENNLINVPNSLFFQKYIKSMT
ncbi:mechanosensitive ion channel domain-containing protein [Candidatus Latescibacterota bacterium]